MAMGAARSVSSLIASTVSPTLTMVLMAADGHTARCDRDASASIGAAGTYNGRRRRDSEKWRLPSAQGAVRYNPSGTKPDVSAERMFMAEELVECVPNFSEGRRPAVIAAIRDAVAAVPGVRILNVDSDA